MKIETAQSYTSQNNTLALLHHIHTLIQTCSGTEKTQLFHLQLISILTDLTPWFYHLSTTKHSRSRLLEPHSYRRPPEQRITFQPLDGDTQQVFSPLSHRNLSNIISRRNMACCIFHSSYIPSIPKCLRLRIQNPPSVNFIRESNFSPHPDPTLSHALIRQSHSTRRSSFRWLLSLLITWLGAMRAGCHCQSCLKHVSLDNR